MRSFLVLIQRSVSSFCLVLLLAAFVSAQVSTDSPSSAPQQIDTLIDSLAATIAAEGQENEQLAARLVQLQQNAKSLDIEANAYKVQISTFSNMLHQDATALEELKKVRATLESALQGSAGQLKEANAGLDELQKLQQEANDQFVLNKEQLEKNKLTVADMPRGKVFLDQLKTLNKVLAEKLQIIANIQGVYAKQIAQFEEIKKSISDLAARFDSQIETKQQQALFDRKDNFLASLEWQQIPKEATKIINEFNQLISLSFWLEQAGLLWKSGGWILLKALLLFVITQLLLFRLRRLCVGVIAAVQSQKPWLCFTLELFERSLILAGTLLFIYVYATARDFFSGLPFISVVVDVLLTWLLTTWFLDFLKLLARDKSEWMPAKLHFRLRLLLGAIRLIAIPYFAFQWALGVASNSLMLARVIFGITLIIWSMNFWREFRLLTGATQPQLSRSTGTIKTALIGWGYAVAVAGLMLELVGYGQLSMHWYVSWARTLGVALWGSLLFFVLREWDQAILAVPVAQRKGSHHLRWLLIRLLWVCWLAVVAAFLLIAWGAKKAVVLGFFRILNQSISLGEIRINLLGIAYAFLILAITLAISRSWRQILKKKVLVQSGLELGLQESITTLSVYVLWVFGILAALHAVGVGATSLTVAFGALGIGLGFGLQNIFNNFISGLVLLFERPIQVGEVIEVGGQWGVVRKINFRSTIVQTYDNAVLIIPNSEFISNQVTNWSFKDQRVRRSIGVGVAYGTDPELVRQTLLEIAEHHPQVLKFPKYDVLFSDFGDSALIFQLRVWSTIDDFLRVETDIRFAIDKLFRERSIEIPFPQLDIHVRSWRQEPATEAPPPEVEAGDKTG